MGPKILRSAAPSSGVMGGRLATVRSSHASSSGVNPIRGTGICGLTVFARSIGCWSVIGRRVRPALDGVWLNPGMNRTIATLISAGMALSLAACASGSDDDATPATPAAATTSAAATTKATAAIARESDPRCQVADEQYVIAVTNGLNDDTFTLSNAQMIRDGDLTFLGATTLRPDGEFENRSDVWILSGLMPFASTGGARNTTEWPKASAAPLTISPGDERVQAVDNCVVNLTLNPSAAPAPAAPAAAVEAPAPAPTVDYAPPVMETYEEPEATEPPIGLTGAPNVAPAPLVGKAIDYCMSDPMYQRGTTKFTDGTTGWTQQCANGG